MPSDTIDDYDYKRYAVLFVDDEANTRKYFRRLFSEKFRILEAEDGVQAMQVFRQHADEIGIIITDQRMPNETGVEFLSKIAGNHPDIIKILSTAYSDIDAAIGSVNEGGIFRYMTKPWDIPQMEVTLRRAMEFFTIKRERDALLGAKMQVIGNVLLSCRLSAFALAPVCGGIPCRHAAQAISSFLKCSLASLNDRRESDSPMTTPNWSNIHHRQVELASKLETALKTALNGTLTDRISALQQTIAAESGNPGSQAIATLTSQTDASGTWLDTILGHGPDSADTSRAVAALACFIAIYDAGGQIGRIRGNGLTLEISQAPARTAGSDGSEVAKWLFDDDMLISAALGLI